MAVSDIIIRLRAVGDKQVAKSLDKVSKSTERLKTNMDTIGRVGRGVSEQFGKLSQEALTWGLGLLFFGMMLKRFFQTILTTTVDFYRKTVEGQTEASQGITRLAASWQFLKFSIGEAIATALLPLIPTLVDIIDKVSNWAQQNPKLVSGVVLIGLAVGTLLMLVGQFSLGLLAVGNAMSKLTVLASGMNASFLLVGLAIAALLVIAAGFISEWKTLFGEGTEGPVKMGDALKTLAAIGITVFKALFIGGKLIAVGLRNVFDTLVIVVQLALVSVMSKIETLLNFAISSINMVISAMNRIPGVDISNIGNVDFGSGTGAFMSDIERRATEASQRSVDLLNQTSALRQPFGAGESQISVNEVTVNTQANEDVVEEIIEQLKRLEGPSQTVV